MKAIEKETKATTRDFGGLCKLIFIALAVFALVMLPYKVDLNDGSLKATVLLAVLPPTDGIPADARRKMNQSFQQAMEFKKSGESVSWSAPQAGVSGEIIPRGTFRLDGSYSRRYVQRLKLSDVQRTYYGMAVRGANGVWGIPRR